MSNAMKNRNYVIHVNRESLCSSVERGKECYKHINSTVERIYSRKHEETKQNKTREQKMNINSSNSNNNKRRLVEKSQFFFSTNQLSTYNRVKKQHHISCARLFFFSLHHWLTKLESHFSNNFYIENPKKWNKKRRKSHIFQTRASKLVRTKFCRQNEMNADRKSRERKTLKVKQTERLRAGARARGGGVNEWGAREPTFRKVWSKTFRTSASYRHMCVWLCMISRDLSGKLINFPNNSISKMVHGENSCVEFLFHFAEKVTVWSLTIPTNVKMVQS